MKRIGCTRIPYPEQMLAMASNLQEKFKTAASVTVTAWDFYPGNTKLTYKIYLNIDDKPSVEFNSWPETLSFYRKLMKGNEDTWKGAEYVP